MLGKRSVKSLIPILFIFIFALALAFFCFSYWSGLKQNKLSNPQCPKKPIVLVDLEKSTYTSNNIKKVVGSIDLDYKLIKGIQYDLFGFSGTTGLFNSYWNEELWDVTDNDNLKHTGWQKLNLEAKNSPVTFGFEPQFPEKIIKQNFLGVYIKAVCKDESTSYSTKIDLMRDNQNSTLRWVSSTKPQVLKNFK